MDWLWQNLFSWLVAEIILVIGGAAAFGYIKGKLPTHAPTLAYSAFGAICVSILIFTITGRSIFSKSPPPLIAPDNVEENIKIWAEHLGMNIGPASEPDSYFARMISLPTNAQQVEVFRAKEKPGYLQFKAIVAVTAENQNIFAKMPQSQVARIMDELSLDIGRANLGCSFMMVTAVNEQLHETILAGVGLQRGTPIQNLNESLFADTFDQLTRGSGLVSSSIRLALPPAEASKSNAPIVAIH